MAATSGDKIDHAPIRSAFGGRYFATLVGRKLNFVRADTRESMAEFNLPAAATDSQIAATEVRFRSFRLKLPAAPLFFHDPQGKRFLIMSTNRAWATGAGEPR